MNKKLKMHKDRQRKHTKVRLRTRFGVKAPDKKINDAIRQISDGSALFMGYQDNWKCKYSVLVDGIFVTVIYDPQTKELVTVLPNFHKVSGGVT